MANKATSARRIWLVHNAASGSNGDKALLAVEQAFGAEGYTIAHSTSFPARELPSPALLDEAGIALVAVFTGDGTINTLLKHLAGWSGAVLILPGGTMNLLSLRLHGEATTEAIIARLGAGAAKPTRPGIVRGPAGDGYGGVMVGPGTSWQSVREAMRDYDVLQMAGGASLAMAETLEGEAVACAEPALGRSEGYPLIMLTPRADGIEIAAYSAQTPGEYLQQTLALLKRNFREGPHEILGRPRGVRLRGVNHGPVGLLIDGELGEPAKELEFILAPPDVDLLATVDDGI